jgi:hypothetical protein
VLPRLHRGGCDRLAHRLGQQPRAAFLPQAVAVPADRDDVAVVEQAVEDRGRDHGSPKRLPHSITERLLVISIAPRSYRRETGWKKRCAASGSNGR